MNLILQRCCCANRNREISGCNSNKKSSQILALGAVIINVYGLTPFHCVADLITSCLNPPKFSTTKRTILTLASGFLILNHKLAT